MKKPFDVFMRVAGIPCGVILVGLLPAVFPTSALGDGPAPAPALEFASGLPGKQVRLTWAAQPGQRYRIEKSTSLGTWSQIALVEPSATDAVWLDPEPTTQKAFYRVMQPQAEVFSISFPVLSTGGGDLRIYGQMIPPGSFLVIQIPGQPPILVPLSALGNGEWQALVSGLFDIGAEITVIGIQDGAGTMLLTLNQPLEVTATGLAGDSPPSLPPAAPVSEGRRLAVHNLGSSGNDGVGVSYLGSSGQDGQEPMRRGNWLARIASGGGDDDCDGFDSPQPLGVAIKTKGTGAANNFTDSGSSLMAVWASRRGYQYYAAKSDLGSTGLQNNPYFAGNDLSGEMPEMSRGYKHPDLMKREMGPGAISPAPSGLPGEVSFQFCALSLETPAGPPLEMIHTYRSKGGHSGGTVAAHWECCYDISVEPIPLSAGSSATRVMLHDGGGREDVFYRQADGTYRCDGMFREGRFDGDTFTLTFADKGTWTFNPLSHPSAAGKIAAIADVHQHSLTCAYDAAGQLEMVSSAFGQRLILSRGSDGSLSSVTDQTGRFVSYTYCGPQDPDGNPGDLKSISPPRLTLVPSVPSTVFTYSTGQKIPALNGNLLSITDAAGRLLEAFTYSGTSNPTDIDFDTCDSHNRNKVGHITLNRREINPATGGYTVFEVDEIGRLTEIDFDRQHREVAVREFTGFCTPDVPVTSQSNRPTGKLHDSDPDYFETTCAYNADSRCTRITRPDGSQELTTYDRDFSKDCPVRERGNARVMSLRAPGGEMRTVTCDYLPDFGTPECFMPGGPIRGISVKCGRNPGGDAITAADKGWDGSVKGKIFRSSRAGGDIGWISAARKGWDGSVKGKLVDFLDMDSDDDGFALLKKEEGGRHTPFHNKIIGASPVAGITGGAIAGIVVGAIVALETEDEDCDGVAAARKGWDGSVKGNGRVTRMVSAYGQVSTFGYNANGDCTSATSPVSGRGSLWSYNSNGQLTSSTVLNGSSPSFTDECVYDAATGFLSSIVSDPAGLHITTSFERDNLGLVTRVVDPLGNDWLYQYNALDQCVQVQSPPCPARISTNFTIDASGRVCRCDVEHRAPDGSLVSSNPVYSTFFVRNERGNLVRVATEELPVNSPPAALAPPSADLASYDVCDITRDNAGQITHLSTPAACRGQASDLACDFSYNERGLLDRCIEGGLGTSGAVTTEYEYDSVRAVVRCTLVVSGIPSPQSIVAYDGFHRPSSITDPMGNVTTYEYANDGSVAITCFGELNDQPGSAQNRKVTRNVLKSYFQTGDIPTQDQFGSLIDRFGRPAINTAFFCVESEDDTLTVERFTPGSTAPPTLEVTTIDRSPAGLIQQIRCNDDVLANVSYDTAGRSNACWNGACSRTVTRNANGQILVCGDTQHFSVGGIPSKTFTVTRVVDALGRCIQSTDGVGNTAHFAFDSLSRCVSETEPGGLVIRTDYDGASAVGPFSARVSADFDGDGTAEILSSSLVRCGELVSVTDSHGFPTTFTNDAIGRCVRCDHPDGTFETSSFDSLGFRAQGTFADGTTQDCVHDLNGRVTSIEWSNIPSGVVAVGVKTMQYDGQGNLTRCAQDSSVVAAVYDSCGDPISETRNGFTVTRAFNHRGRTGIAYPDGKRFQEIRNAFGDLLSVSGVTPAGVVLSPPIVSQDYLGHQVCRTVQRNGVITTYAYRGDGEASPAGSEDFSFGSCVRETITDASSNVLSDTLTSRDPNKRTCTCMDGYYVQSQLKTRITLTPRDAFGNVTSCVISRSDSATLPPVVESSVSYTYDIDGTRLTELRNGAAGDYTRSALPPALDLQMGQYSSWPGGALSWDPNGNIGTFQKGTSQLTFVHDAEGRLVRVDDSTGNAVIGYGYSADGRRCEKLHRSPTTGTLEIIIKFAYDGSDCIQELGTDNLADMTFVCADGIRQCISTRNGTIYYPHGGGSGSSLARASVEWEKWEGVLSVGTSDASLRLITNATGSPVERFACDESGKPIFLTSEGGPSSATSSTIGLRWMAPECAWEPELGMFACPGGIYSPDLGIMVSKVKPPKNGEGKKEFVGHVSLLK